MDLNIDVDGDFVSHKLMQAYFVS